MKYFYSIFIALLIAALVLFLAFPELHRNNSMKRTETNVIRDTIVRVITPEPITLAIVKTRIIRTSDTVIKFSPFKAVVDTIHKQDTIRTVFEYPSGILSLDIRRRPDTVLTEKIRIYEPQKKKEPWWEKPAVILGSAAAGYLLGTISNK